MRRSELKESARSRNIVGILRWETGKTGMGDRDKRLRNVLFDILTRTTTNWDINRTTKKANVHKNMFFFQ